MIRLHSCYPDFVFRNTRFHAPNFLHRRDYIITSVASGGSSKTLRASLKPLPDCDLVYPSSCKLTCWSSEGPRLDGLSEAPHVRRCN